MDDHNQEHINPVRNSGKDRDSSYGLPEAITHAAEQRGIISNGIKAYAAWTLSEDNALKESYAKFLEARKQSRMTLIYFLRVWEERLSRKQSAIRSRLRHLGLLPAAAQFPKAAACGFERRRSGPQTDTEPLEMNRQFTDALAFLEDGEEHVFLTGNAGTGKSTLLKYFLRTTKKNVAVLAPTGVAALLIGGQTIHSFFRFPVGITPESVRYVARARRPTYEALDAIVIDEVSMVRADLLDAVDAFLRKNGRTSHKPFGGVKMIFVGDLFQLPPIVPSGEEDLFRHQYEGPYFFNAHAFAKTPVRCIELTTVYRQRDDSFIKLLNAIRTSSATERELAAINARQHAYQKADGQRLAIYLTTRTFMADEINHQQLTALPGRVTSFEGTVEGSLAENDFPTAKTLALKPGAQVMFLVNDPAKRWVNGDIGTVSDFIKEEGSPRIRVAFADGKRVTVAPYQWEKNRFFYSAETKRLESEPVGLFTQYPLRLAWAVTIHKAQGKTFDNVVVDFGEGTFAPGQAYVALSRCTSLEGLTLKTPLEKRHLFVDDRVVEFMKRINLGVGFPK